MPKACRYLVSLAQIALLVVPFSAYTFVPLSRGLVRKLVMGWPAVAYRATAGLSQDIKHRASQVRVP